MITNSVVSLLKLFSRKTHKRKIARPLNESDGYTLIDCSEIPPGSTIGLIAGNGSFPILFAKEARERGYKIAALCHENETDKNLEACVDISKWIKLGQLGSLISFFKETGVQFVAMAGGISRVKHFGDVKLDARGASLMLRLRSTKDDVVMRGIASELKGEGIEVIPCTLFMTQSICPLGHLTDSIPSSDEYLDIEVGVAAIKAMSSQDIGQLVVVREGIVVAVEAVEGSDETMKRGAALGGSGGVVVKLAKPTQDMRFDVPTIGIKTLELLKELNVRVLALEAGRSLILDRARCIELANNAGISIIGLKPLVKEILAPN